MIELNNIPQSRAGVIFPEIRGQRLSVSSEARLSEAAGLAEAINLQTPYQEIINIREVKPGNFFGQGIIAKLQQIIQDEKLDLLIIDASLSPIQQRNLEKQLQIKVIDRTALILEIFGERAQTKEGTLQVELAHLTYQRSRLVRSWTHLERQRGGAGFLGGPGETQIELDRRIIDDKIIRIKKDLEKVKKTRELQRGARSRIPYPVVALVGYTNAGKSTLFNALTQAGVLAEDMLFATLDPSMKKLELPSGKEVILSDTVGFISDLPHELIMAFRATLEEVLAADVVVHVLDSSNPDRQSQRKDVLDVLHNLGLENIELQKNYIEALNKTDLLTPSERETAGLLQERNPEQIVPVSALSGQGLEQLLALIDKKLNADNIETEIKISAADGKLQAWIYANAEVLEAETKNDKTTLRLSLSEANYNRLRHKLELPLQSLGK